MADIYLGRGKALAHGKITPPRATVHTLLRRAFALPDARSKPRKHKRNLFRKRSFWSSGGSILPKISQIQIGRDALRRTN